MSTCMEIEKLRRLKVVLSALAFMGLFVFSIDDSSAQESYEFQRLGYRTYLDEDCDASKSPVSQLNPEAHFQRVGYVGGNSRRNALPKLLAATGNIRIGPGEEALSEQSAMQGDDKHTKSTLNAQVIECDNGRQVILTNLHGIRDLRKNSRGEIEEFTQPWFDVQDIQRLGGRYRVVVPWDLMQKEGLSGYRPDWRGDSRDGVMNSDPDWAVIPLKSRIPQFKGATVCPISKVDFESQYTSGNFHVLALGYHTDRADRNRQILVEANPPAVIDNMAERSDINRYTVGFGYDSFPGSSGMGIYRVAKSDSGQRIICLSAIHSAGISLDYVERPDVASGLYATARLITPEDKGDTPNPALAIRRACNLRLSELPDVTPSQD